MKRDRKFYEAIAYTLSNDEGSDEGMHEYFRQEFDLTQAEANAVMALRQKFLLEVIMPMEDAIEYIHEALLEARKYENAKAEVPKDYHKLNAHKLNKAIEHFIDSVDKNKNFTKEEIDFISRYEGSGGLVKHGATGRGILNEFYTPDWLSEMVWKLARAHGFSGGTVLEPSCGTGRLFVPAPEKFQCVGFEINKYSAFIASKRFQGITIHNLFFEQAFMEPPRFNKRMKGFSTWLKGSPFSLVIGNPPYGKYHNEYSTFFKRPMMLQVELMFFYYGLQLLRPGGLLIYVVSSNVLRNGIKYYEVKKEIGKIAEIVDAYRLPPVFEHSDVPTDIIVLKRKP